MMTLLKRTVVVLASIEIIYLVVANTVLNLQVTQDMINRIRPEKFSVSWESAWSPYPTRVHATGVAASGESKRQQWQASATRAGASISLFRLAFKTVRLSNVDATDVIYRQRPRPRPDKDYSNVRDYFPPMDARVSEREPVQDAQGTTKKKPKKPKTPWNLDLTDMHVTGSHKLWLYQVQVALRGDLHADLSLQTKGGPLSLDNGSVDVRVDSLVLNGNREVVRDARIKGQAELLPFIPAKNKGLKSLAFLNVDANIDVETESLAFLNLYLEAFQGMKMNGYGLVNGHAVLEQGRLQPGTDLKVTASKLGMDLLGYSVEGDGRVSIAVPEKTSENHIGIVFDSLAALDLDGQTPLITGNGLAVNAIGNNVIVPLDGQRPRAKSIAMTIPAVKVPDLKAYQRFLPDKWAFRLHGGEGELEGRVELSREKFNADVRLSSSQADVGIKDYRFQTNLDIYTTVDSPSLEKGIVDISGSYLKLNDARLSREEEDAAPWYAEINIGKGVLHLNLDEAPEGVTGVKHLLQSLRNKNVKSMLADADNELEISGRVSDLRWLNLLLKNPYDLAIRGAGEITAKVVVDSGWLAEGTYLKIKPEQLIVDVLDYQARGAGDGGVELNVIKGGEFPDMSLDIAVHNAAFGRKGEQTPFVEDVDITLQALGREMKLDGSGDNVELRFNIPSAKINDMTVYNEYLPDHSPLLITDGKASLVADLLLKPGDADGYVRLTTEDMHAHVDDQEVSARLTADIRLVGGEPGKMAFDISGSSIVLDGVKVIGDEKSFRDEDWAARFDLTQGKTVWKKPVQLDLKAEVEMSDSIPIVSMIANKKGKHGWLGKALTIDDVKGDMEMHLANQQIVIPYAFAGSDKIDIGAKGIIGDDLRNGVLYVRFRKLHGILKIKDGERNIDVLKAREKFDGYSTDAVLNATADR